MAFRIFASTRYFDLDTQNYLESQGCEVLRSGLPDGEQDDRLDPDILNDRLKDIDGWIVGAVRVTRSLLEAHPSIKVIARRGVGYNNVDIESARALRRVVTIAPGGNEPAVADYAIAMMLAVARRLREGHDTLRAGKWQPLVGVELYKKTVGIIGFGRIGRMVAKRLSGFDAKILAYDPFFDKVSAESFGVNLTDLETLLRESDFISLHLPLTQKTHHIIDQNAFTKIKPSAIIINTARGGLIDEEALLLALKNGCLGGAGLDVFEGEANHASRSILEDLLSLQNVVASAHAAGSSKEGLQRANRIAAESVLKVLRGEPLAKDYIVVDGRSASDA